MAKGGGKKGLAPAPGKKQGKRGNVVAVKDVNFDDDVSDEEELLNKQVRAPKDVELGWVVYAALPCDGGLG